MIPFMLTDRMSWEKRVMGFPGGWRQCGQYLQLVSEIRVGFNDRGAEMHEEEKINPKHRKTRRILRVMGPLFAGTGVVLMAIGMGSFFLALAGGGPPRFFWCTFLGMPILFVGTVISMFAFMGAVTRYQAGEVAPVGKDTFNYLAEGTKGGVQTMATALGAGLAQGMAGSANPVRCSQCGHRWPADAKFCAECGSELTM